MARGKKQPNKSVQKITNAEKSMIEELLKSAVQEYSVKFENNKIERHDIAQRITSLLSEFLPAFFVIGYDMKGQPFNLMHASNQMDADALTAALNKFLFNLNHNND
jgi:hypothetical protein